MVLTIIYTWHLSPSLDILHVATSQLWLSKALIETIFHYECSDVISAVFYLKINNFHTWARTHVLLIFKKSFSSWLICFNNWRLNYSKFTSLCECCLWINLAKQRWNLQATPLNWRAKVSTVSSPAIWTFYRNCSFRKIDAKLSSLQIWF